VFSAFIDTCVLYRHLVCDTLLTLAEDELYRPLWSEGVLEELERNLADRIGPVGATGRVGSMRRSFDDAIVTGYEPLVNAITNDAKDRHILAAAVRSGADLLVTDNLRDFPPESTQPYDLEVITADAFLLNQLDLAPAATLVAMRRQVSRYSRPPRSLVQLLDALGRPGNACGDFAAACRRYL